MIKILDTGIQSADFNMRFDERLLRELGDTPILHLYRWAKPSATYGYFIRPEKHLRPSRRIDLARRPTGGGIVFHIWDIAFSFLLPSSHPAFSANTLENYQFVNNAVLATIREYFSLNELELISQNAPSLGPDCHNFCMAKPTQYDVIYQGLKIAGAAQRKRRQGYLHQGTLSLARPDFSLLEEILVSQEQIIAAMQSYTFAPFENERQIEEVRPDIEKLLADKLIDSLQSYPDEKVTHRDHPDSRRELS
jgi:lipoate-protein ligase A